MSWNAEQLFTIETTMPGEWPTMSRRIRMRAHYSHTNQKTPVPQLSGQWIQLLSVISQDHGHKLERKELWSNSLFKTNDCHVTPGRHACFLMLHLVTLSHMLKKFTGERAQEATRMKVLHLIGATLNGWAVLSGSYVTVGQIEGHSVFFSQLLIT